ncbi:MAG TPA: cyclodeaminase/cyclohydrolase family protein [Bryobacteraceae bacterium]|nr:cyclodeaminase/cyclohydrolase family protein [Bryobacteraceae bacterium]
MTIWTAPLASFCEDLASTKPAPAGVAASAVSARLGLSLLIKVLTITAQRPDLIEPARRESENLARAAEDDIRAIQARDASQVLEVPMRAARAAVAGLDLCAEASGSVRGWIAADLGASRELLAGAARAILLCVDANLQRSPNPEVAAERRQLGARVG